MLDTPTDYYAHILSGEQGIFLILSTKKIRTCFFFMMVVDEGDFL